MGVLAREKSCIKCEHMIDGTCQVEEFPSEPLVASYFEILFEAFDLASEIDDNLFFGERCFFYEEKGEEINDGK